MQTINLFQAKTHLSKLIDQIASGEETEFIIARSGKPVARILPVAPPTRRAGSASLRASLSKGGFLGRRLPPDLSQETLVNFSCITLWQFLIVPDDIDRHNEEVARLFTGTPPTDAPAP